MSEVSLHNPQQVSLCDALDRLLNTGVVAAGDLTISVAEIDLIYLGVQLVVTAVENPDNSAGAATGANRMPPDRGTTPRPTRRDTSGARLEPIKPHGWGDQPGLQSAAAERSHSPLDFGVQVKADGDFIPSLPAVGPGMPATVAPKPAPATEPNSNAEKAKNGLGRLVLTLMKLLHELLERQAIRRIESGYLRPAEMERLGVTLMRQAQEIDRLRHEFGLSEADLNLDLGPIGKLL